MKKIALAFALFGATSVTAFYADPAHAQATRTWVSGVGDDANPCSRTAPCKTFAGAISKTSAGGEIDNLDTGGFGALTITKSITIDGGGGAVASVLVAGTPGITVAAGSNDVVILRNLQFQGLLGNGTSPGSAGTIGINITSAAKVNVEHVEIMGFSGRGISDSRTGGGTSLFVKDTDIQNNGSSGVSCAGSGTTMVLENVHTVGNVYGLGCATGNSVVISRSVMSGNTTGGVEADSGANVFIDNTVIAGNGTGVVPGGTIVLGNSDIVFNGTGISGATSSFGNNRIFGNTSAGTAPTGVSSPATSGTASPAVGQQ
jgi:hypothetical protein